MLNKPTITHKELTVLTGLSDRRFRQLSAANFFPAAKRGVYETEATLRGLFKYYQQLNDPDIKRKTAHEVWRKHKIANDKADGKLIDADKNDALLLRVSKGFQSILRQKLCNELPSNAAGQDAPAIAILAENVFNKTVQEIKKFLNTPELRAILEKEDEAA